MKCVCISCFNNYDVRMKAVMDCFTAVGFNVTYVISDFNHYSKERFLFEKDNIKQIHVPQYRHNLSIMRLLSHFYFSVKTKRILDEINPGIIYCMFPPNYLVSEISKYKLKRKVKVILDCFDFWPESLLGPTDRRVYKFPFSVWRNMREKNLRTADLIVCCTSQMKDYYAKQNYPVQLLWPSISRLPIQVCKTDVSDSITFCIIGMINHIIDIELVIDFLGGIAASKKVNLHIIGEGDNLPMLESKLMVGGVNVIKHGVIFDFEKKWDIISQCNFGLNIPKEKINSGMALKMVEYLSFGLPVINSGMGDSKQLIAERHLGFNLNRSNCTEVARLILQITSDNIMAMSNNCNSTYETFFSGDNLRSFIRKLLISWGYIS